MFTLLQLLSLLVVSIGLLYMRAAVWIWTTTLAILLVFISVYGTLSWWLLIPIGLVFLMSAVLFTVKPLRLRLLTTPIAALVKKAMPPMSVTEREALDAGDVWWDGELFCGRPDWNKLLTIPKPTLTSDEQAFLDKQVETLCQMLNDWRITHETCDLPKEAWDYLKKEGFFGMIIPKEYGGLGFSALAHSAVVVKIATRSVSAAVDAMVPNSLGPAELLCHYGTEQQKNYYLPRLARGEEIPCFALTGLEAGSDAAAMTDTGIVCKGQFEGKTVIGIRLNWNKRYITLAPVATVLGLAFKMFDPDHLLSAKEDIGITVCLIPTNHPGVEIGKRHFPLNAAFLNGPTRGKDVFIPLDWIIGGAERVGQGWRMLMECLSAGRSISLPALSAATGKLCYRVTGAYARLRCQFKIPIGRFEGIEEALAQIGGYTYLLEATRLLSLSAVDQNIKPAVVSAIAKYHTTEMSRKVINYAMDIHGGKGIQLGPRNYLGRGYEGIPISITVEGANILTRNLIIFGQGAIRCHPYLRHEMDVLLQESETALGEFDRLLVSHMGYAASNFARCLVLGLSNAYIASSPVKGAASRYYQQITRMSVGLALVADIAMLLLGGELKRKERLSARLGDVLSYLYMASAVLKYYRDHGENSIDLPYVQWAIKTCFVGAQHAFDNFFANFPNKIVGWMLRFLVFPLGKVYHSPSDKIEHKIAEHMQEISEFRDRLTSFCYIGKEPDDALGRLECAMQKLSLAEPIEKKLRNTLRERKITRRPFAEQIGVAVTEKILTEQEAQLLREFEEARWDAMQVDEFTSEYLAKKDVT